MLIAALMMTAAVLNAGAAKSFTDMKGHWAKDYVTKAVDRGYVSGYSDGTFRPNNSITRAEFCKMLNSALGISSTAQVSFTDLKSSQWYYTDVQKAVGAGYIGGYDDGTFKGDNKITRQEAAVVMSRIVTSPSKTRDLSGLRDSSSIASWAKNGVKIVYSKGYMVGDNNRRFNPSGNLTRAESVKIIESLLDKETIVKSNLTVLTAGQSYSDKIYVGSVVVSQGVGKGSVTFTNCRILGTMLVNGGGTSGIRLAGTRVSNMTVNNTQATVGVACAGASTVCNTYVSTPCALTEASLTGIGTGFENVTLGGTGLSGKTVTLSGNYNTVTVNSSKAGLDLTSGRIASLVISSSASGSEIGLSSGTTVDKATINAPCSFTGQGKITLAEQNVNDVTYTVRPGKITGSGTTAKYVTVTTDPKNGTKNTGTDGVITLTFGEAVKNADGGNLTAAYVQNTAVEMRSGSQNGTKVTFYAEISSSGKSIVIYPFTKLKDNTEYYIIVKAGAFRTTSGAVNQAVVSSFNTGNGSTSGTLVPTVTPSDGSQTIRVDTDIILEFDEKLYNVDGGTLTSDYVRSSVIELRRGSQSGRKVAFNASVSSDKKKITVTPSGELDTNTKYYVILLGGSLRGSGKELNKEQTFSFTTAASDVLVPVADPASGSSNISTDSSFTFTFDNRMYNASGNALTSSYLQKTAFVMRRGSTSGTKVSFTASISSDKRKITITPDDGLDSNTNYYIIINEDSLTDEYFDGVPEMIFNYKTASGSATGKLEPSSTSPKNGKTGVARNTDITISYPQALLKANGNTLTDSYIEDTAITIRKGSQSGTKVSFTADVSSSKKTITLHPDRDLSRDTKYYVVIAQDVFSTSSGAKNTKYVFNFTVGTSSSGGVLAPYETSPSDEQTGVSMLADIKLYFDEAIYRDNGSSLSDSYMKNNVFEIRRGSQSGTKITFSASISSNKKTVTLSPSSGLSSGYTYYVIMKESTISNSGGDLNDEYVFSFSVGSSGSANPSSVSPSNGASNVNTNTQIQLYFDDTVYRNSSRSSMTTSQILNNVQIRKTNNSSSAYRVSYTPSISSGGRTITLTLNEYLENNTKYYIYIPSGTFYNYSGTANSSTSYYFTTRGAAALTAPTMTPANGETGVQVGLDNIRLTYSDSLLTSSGAAVTSDYLAGQITVKKGSTTVPFTAAISNNKNIILTLDSATEFDATYTVTVKSGAFKTSAGAISSSVSYSFTTKSPSLSLTEKHGKDWATVTVSYDFTGADDVTFKVEMGGTVLRSDFQPKSSSGSFDEELTGLTEGTSYTVKVTMTYGGGRTKIQTVSFTTAKTSTNNSLSSIKVADSEGVYNASISGNSATITGELKPASGRLDVTLTAADPEHAVITVDGVGKVTSGQSFRVSVLDGESTHVLDITVTAEDSSEKQYTLTIPIYQEPTEQQPQPII